MSDQLDFATNVNRTSSLKKGGLVIPIKNTQLSFFWNNQGIYSAIFLYNISMQSPIFNVNKQKQDNFYTKKSSFNKDKNISNNGVDFSRVSSDA